MWGREDTVVRNCLLIRECSLIGLKYLLIRGCSLIGLKCLLIRGCSLIGVTLEAMCLLCYLVLACSFKIGVNDWF